MNTRKLFRILNNEIEAAHKRWVENDRKDDVEALFRSIVRIATTKAAQILFDEIFQKGDAATAMFKGYDWDPVIKCKFCKKPFGEKDAKLETGYGKGVYGCLECTVKMENERRDNEGKK